MALKIRRQNTSILDTFNDEDIQKEYDKIKSPIIADNIDDAYEQYLLFKKRDIFACYKTKSLEELRKWIKEQNKQGVDVLDVSWIDVSGMTHLSFCFCDDDTGYDFTEINGLENWDVSNVKYMQYMFDGCKYLTEIKGLENWDVSNVIYMIEMFNGCKELKTLDLSNWDVSKVRYMIGMFHDCKKLKTLDLSNWADKVQNVIHMIAMFNGCNESIIPSWYPRK